MSGKKQFQPASDADMAAPAAAVEDYLRQYLKQLPLPANLVEAVEYSSLGPGKRMRPILVLRACEAVGGSWDQAMPAAAAIELIHCFSLVHDDLPAMDNDDLRRGRPTLHRHTTEAMAILAGDLMMGLAVELILKRIAPADLSLQVAGELVGGTNAMIAGQVYDSIGGFEPGLSDADRLKQIHENKTGALLLGSVRMGGLCGRATPEQLENLSDYGRAVGLMFQIVDDLLDITQTTEHLGKTAGKDVDQNKRTYPALYGIEESRRQVIELQAVAHRALGPLGAAAGPLGAICDYLAVRTK